jgi:nucleotidyltransferase AbiEii toxin of type IV toxin-antitoxin system
VVAEKLEALVRLGLANSRLKDFYDLWMLSRTVDFDGPVLVQALTATFMRRRTPVPTTMPLGLTPAFAELPAKLAQWQAFIRRGRLLTEPPLLTAVLAELRAFLGPPLHAAAQNEALSQCWPAGGPWTPAGAT